MIVTKSSAFSVVEVLLSLIIICLVGISALQVLSYIKKQDLHIQKFILHGLSVLETQIFINKIISFAKVDSIKVSKDSIQGYMYKNLFESGDIHNSNDSKIMNYSLNTNDFTLTLHGDRLLFNDSLLLSGVSNFSMTIDNINADLVLSYTICTKECIKDFIVLENVEINK